MTPMTPVREAARKLDGCLARNHARDVLDVMEAMDISFMPLVDEFSGAPDRGAVTRSELATVVARLGLDARVTQVRPVLLPNVAADTPVGQVAVVAGPAPAYVVTERGGRLVGIYEPDGRGAA